jgi:hypothetical protein
VVGFGLRGQLNLQRECRLGEGLVKGGVGESADCCRYGMHPRFVVSSILLVAGPEVKSDTTVVRMAVSPCTFLLRTVVIVILASPAAFIYVRSVSVWAQ